MRVDNSAQPNSRWYSGSGIYRHVRVIVTNPSHVAHWGVFVTTPAVTEATGKLQVQTTVANESDADTGLMVQTALLDAAGKAVGSAESSVDVAARKEANTSQNIVVANPARLVS